MKPAGNAATLRNSFHRWRKVDLHCHLDGARRVETIFQIARKQKIAIPADSPEELKKFVQVSPSCRSLTDFLKCFTYFYEVLKSAETMERISYELCEDTSAENVRYFEPRYAPALQESKDFHMEDSLRPCCADSAGGKNSKSMGVILCIFRSHTKEVADETVRLGTSADGVVAVIWPATKRSIRCTSTSPRSTWLENGKSPSPATQAKPPDRKVSETQSGSARKESDTECACLKTRRFTANSLTAYPV